MSGDSGTASAPRIGENTVSSNVTKQVKDVPFSTVVLRQNFLISSNEI